MTTIPIPSIDELLSDREKFNNFVYTPIKEAAKELEKRTGDKELERKISAMLDNYIPEPFVSGPKAVFFGYATPNHEVMRFVSIADMLKNLEILFLEYLDDKFVPENERKFFLAKPHFFHGIGKRGGKKIDRINIINFNKCNGEKISSVKTLWGQPLIDFHHELFKRTNSLSKLNFSYFDTSPWFCKTNFVPLEYYKMVFKLFVRNGILFENFMLDKKEFEFTREVILPAFIDTIRQTGHKPLIVALEPTEIEGDQFWLCYPTESEMYTKNKLSHAMISPSQPTSSQKNA